ncbi:MAG: hypothetical protein ACD_49C00023G0001 [uncultured bacterium (gcode 4)]|uniref:Uncharacterized protein n=1 Tax=uncultured bacterium (gcode 4) TaxID=1234023 RepID=K2BD54_9BACT|nr:MAG: hypothetical protein ACD_49C00023G0001 [uncultured bacterium (gcode 4)]
MLFAARFVFIEVSDFFELISEVFALISASLLVLSFLTNSIFFKTSHSQIRDKLSWSSLIFTLVASASLFFEISLLLISSPVFAISTSWVAISRASSNCFIFKS